MACIFSQKVAAEYAAAMTSPDFLVDKTGPKPKLLIVTGRTNPTTGKFEPCKKWEDYARSASAPER